MLQRSNIASKKGGHAVSEIVDCTSDLADVIQKVHGPLLVEKVSKLVTRVRNAIDFRPDQGGALATLLEHYPNHMSCVPEALRPEETATAWLDSKWNVSRTDADIPYTPTASHRYPITRKVTHRWNIRFMMSSERAMPR